MSILNELGKKVTTAGQKTVQRSKEMADIVKLNSYIGDEEKKINNAFLEIGKKYYEDFKDNADERFSESIGFINNSMNKIDEYKQQIQELRKVKKCSNCGKEIPNEAGFCSFCGAAVVVEEPEEEKIYCSNCGKPVLKSSSFCGYCGSKVEADFTPAEEDNVAEAVEETAEKAAEAVEDAAEAVEEVKEDE